MGYPAFFPFSLLNRHLTSSLYIFLSASCVALSGCAGAHLYDTQNDGIAAGGKKNLAEAKLLEVIPAQVTNQDAMLAHELDAVRRYVNVQASADISHVIESKRPIAEVWVEDKVVTRLDALGFKGGDLDARLAELSNFHQKLQFVDQIGAQLRDISDAYFDGLKVFPPSCPADGRLPPLGEIADDGRTHAEVIIDKAVREGAPRDDAQALLPVFYGDFGGKCAELRAKQTELRTEGMISTALADYQGANQEIEQLRPKADLRKFLIRESVPSKQVQKI